MRQLYLAGLLVLSASALVVHAQMTAVSSGDQAWMELAQVIETPSPTFVASGPTVFRGKGAELMKIKRPALEAMYRQVAPGPIPHGKANGTASSAPGTRAGAISQAVYSALWQGKEFVRRNEREADLINHTALGRTGDAKVYYAESWLDGKPSIIIDYKSSGTSAARGIRDEIRMLAPGIYLGFAYFRPQQGEKPSAQIVFALDFVNPKEAP